MKGMPVPGIPMAGMHGTPIGDMTMALRLCMVMMAAMMLPSAAASGTLLIGAGVYELTPLKRECRRRCRERVRSGGRFGALCFGSSIGLMLVLVLAIVALGIATAAA